MEALGRFSTKKSAGRRNKMAKKVSLSVVEERNFLLAKALV